MSMTPVRFVLFTLSLAVSMAPLRAAFRAGAFAETTAQPAPPKPSP